MNSKPSKDGVLEMLRAAAATAGLQQTPGRQQVMDRVSDAVWRVLREPLEPTQELPDFIVGQAVSDD